MCLPNCYSMRKQVFCLKSLVLQMPFMLSPEKVPASLALHSIKNWRKFPTLSFPTIVRLVYWEVHLNAQTLFTNSWTGRASPFSPKWQEVHSFGLTHRCNLEHVHSLAGTQNPVAFLTRTIFSSFYISPKVLGHRQTWFCKGSDIV